MIIKKRNSRAYIVNLLTDFILSKISHNENSIISVTDVTNFYVINGKTTSKDILDLSKICTEFSEKFGIEKPISRTIDLIEYNSNLEDVTNLTFTLHNSENCSYHPLQVEKFKSNNQSYEYCNTPIEVTDTQLVVTSEFPHGYSLNQGRLLYLYGKHIFYSIPSNYPVTTLTFNLSTEKNNNGENNISVFNHSTSKNDETLKSAILDSFDFDFSIISTEIKKVDWSVELINPLDDYFFIKDINKNFIIF